MFIYINQMNTILDKKAVYRGRPINEDAREIRIEQILDGAMVAFVNHGFHGASMTHISRAAKVSAANIYQYFPNKESLIVAQVERLLSYELMMIGQITDAGLTLDSIRKVLGDYFQTNDGYRLAVMRVEIMAEATRNNEIQALVQQWDLRTFNEIKSCISFMRSRLVIPETVTPEIAADKIVLLYDGVFNRYVINPHHGSQLVEKFASEIQQILDSDLRHE